MKPGRGDRLRLQDILDSIAEVQRHFPAERHVFDANPLLQSHILRHIMIVGEAAFKLSKPLKLSQPQIPVINRGYAAHSRPRFFKVNWSRVYDTAGKDLPILKPQIEVILKALLLDDQLF